jgi:hypothetical protein
MNIVIVFELTYSLEEFALYIKDLLLYVIIKHQLDYIFSLSLSLIPTDIKMKKNEIPLKIKITRK